MNSKKDWGLTVRGVVSSKKRRQDIDPQKTSQIKKQSS